LIVIFLLPLLRSYPDIRNSGSDSLNDKFGREQASNSMKFVTFVLTSIINDGLSRKKSRLVGCEPRSFINRVNLHIKAS
jgi:hypothetical protein